MRADRADAAEAAGQEPSRQDPSRQDLSRQAVAAYKTILRMVIDQRPSGARQRLADAIGKNRSFITQITNPAYAVPVPAQHLPVIFEICRFSPADREAFLEAYHAAHPRRPVLVREPPAVRQITIDLPDLGEPRANRRLERMVRAVAASLAAAAADDSDAPGRHGQDGDHRASPEGRQS
jgi:hypothetical protein